MKIAIISDTHNRHDHVRRALKQATQRQADLIIHCGDIEDTDTVWLFPPGTHFVFGNCDWDRVSLRDVIQELGATLHEPFGELELAGKKVAFVHGDDKKLLDRLEQCGQYDIVCHGHTHVASDVQSGSTRIINPGALHRVRTRTFAVLDLSSGSLESVVVE